MNSKPNQKTTRAMGEAQKNLREMMETIRPFTKPERSIQRQKPARWVSGETSGLQSSVVTRQR